MIYPPAAISPEKTIDEQVEADTKLKPIAEIAQRIGINTSPEADEFVPYGHYKCKLPKHHSAMGEPKGKLILVTGINPTKFGAGKTTSCIGLCDGMNHIFSKENKDETAVCALREPSLGPVLGMKGGATGGGKAQVGPSADINLHFNGDLHAITCAHNLCSAMIDNHMYFQKEPRIDARRITWRRVLDMNDRALRKMNIGLGGPGNGYPREDGFDISNFDVTF